MSDRVGLSRSGYLERGIDVDTALMLAVCSGSLLPVSSLLPRTHLTHLHLHASLRVE